MNAQKLIKANHAKVEIGREILKNAQKAYEERQRQELQDLKEADDYWGYILEEVA